MCSRGTGTSDDGGGGGGCAGGGGVGWAWLFYAGLNLSFAAQPFVMNWLCYLAGNTDMHSSIHLVVMRISNG